MPKTRVLVVDDSLFMRKLITRLVEEDPELQVEGTAKNGEEAVRMVGQLRPDVITMDIEMPVMNGLDAVSAIMKAGPVPILMLSSLTQEGAAETIEALRRGAVDFIGKPSGSTSADLYKIKAELLAKIKTAAATPAAALKPVAALGRSSITASPPEGGVRANASSPKTFSHIVAIGTSTGGPRALDAVISTLPAGFACPVLVVQHMPPKFTRSLAERLDKIAQVRVVEAEDGEPVRAATVYIAPGDHHISAVEKNGEYRIRLTQDPQRNGHRPSADVLFESIAKLSRLKRHFVLMTGMGQDGARGMLLGKETGASSTIAEAKETCVVFGMPRSAIELKCVDHIEPLDRIAAKIVEVTRKP